MPANVPLGPALRQLRARGFGRVHISPKLHSFEGSLPCAAGPVPVRLNVCDWDFLSYPTIQLLARPAFLPKVLPHVSAEGVLCLFAESSVVLDRFRPDIAVAQCLDKATWLLDQMVTDSKFYEAEFRGEFLVHWAHADGPSAFGGLVGEHPKRASAMQWYEVGPADYHRLFVSADFEEVASFCQAAGWPHPTQIPIAGALFTSDKYPACPAHGLPKNLSEAFTWLKAWDRRIYDEVQEHLLDRKLIKKRRRELLFGSPAGWFGMGFSLERAIAVSFQRSRPYRQYLHTHAKEIAVERRVFQEAGSTHVHQRNLMRLDAKSLAGKKIALVGCGAIGSFLAAGLTRLGAGTGGGLLRCYDAGQLEPDNLGRHWLGYEGLFRNKAQAVAERAKAQFPFSHIEGLAQNLVPSALPKADLVINATGEAAFAEALNAHHVDGERKTPVLHLWVAGNGEAAQGLWVDAGRGGCYRCLKLDAGEDFGKPRFPLLKAAPVRAFVGCHAFTPYSTTMPTVAAALACDFVMDWLEGEVSPRFRTRVHEHAQVFKVKNQDIDRLKGCPACAR